MKAVDSCALFEGIGYIDGRFIEEAAKPLGKSPARPAWLKGACAVAASFAAIVMALFSVNMAFPAFAESLPLIGEAFRYWNALGAHAPTYEGMVQPVGVSAENNQYKLTAQEAYCDGEYVFLTFRLDAKEAKLLRMESLETVERAEHPGWDVAINGLGSGLNYSLPVFTRRGYYFESQPVQIRLPEPVADGGRVQVDIGVGALSGRTQEEVERGEPGQTVSTEPVALGVELTADTSRNRQHAGESVSIHGLALTGWSSSPSKLSVTFSYPYFGAEGLYAAARTEDGTQLGEDLRENGDLGGEGYRPGDTAVQTCSFTGPPEDARSVTVTVYVGKPGEERRTVGAFTIDLETGEITAPGEGAREFLSIEEYAAGKNSGPAPAAQPSPSPQN